MFFSMKLFDVICRNHYYCTVYAARLMVPRKQGLIVTISSPGGLRYLFNVPYGVGKAAVRQLFFVAKIVFDFENFCSVIVWQLIQDLN